MKYIFIDTNIIQHSIQHENKSEIMKIYEQNLKNHKIQLYLLPQVICEIEEHGINYQDWIWSILNINVIDDIFDYNINLINNIIWNMFIIWEQKNNNYKKYIANSFYYIENAYEWATKNIPPIDEIKKIVEKRFWVDFNKDTNAINIWDALASLIESTPLWDIKYKQFTYKDIYRFTGNFMFDFKNYKTKQDKQKSKVGKDSQIVLQLCIWINSLWINLKNDKIIFMSSDYGFIKELISLKSQINSLEIIKKEHYSDLSHFFLEKLIEVFSNLNIIKFDINKLLFQNESWIEDVQIINLI